MNHINKEIERIFLKQTTLKAPINFSGVGVHNGRAVSMSIEPAEVGTGIVFHRTDLENNNVIKAFIDNIFFINNLFFKFCNYDPFIKSFIINIFS